MFKYELTFQMHYKALVGQNIVIVGNCASLGNWDINKGIQMSWSKDDFWRKTIFLYHNRRMDIEYKYVLCSQQNGALEPLRWESGPNRVINCSKTLRLDLFLNDVWEHRKICLRIKNPFQNSKHALQIVGNVNDIKYAKPMDIIYKKDPTTDLLECFWQKEFYVEVNKPSFKYSYILYEDEKKNGFWEREHVRTFYLNDLKDQNEFQNSYLPLKRDKTRNYNELISYTYKNNTFKIYDYDFNHNFAIDEINENIIIGPYPQTAHEIELLQKKGVKAVLNLQRDVDMKMRKLDWNDIKEIYGQNNIDVLNYQINDSDPEELTEKIIVAADILNKLIRTYQRVYVHCTAGIIRAPHTVIAYLCLFKHYPLENAIRLLKKKRPIAHPNKRCLEKALTSLNVMTRCITFI